MDIKVFNLIPLVLKAIGGEQVATKNMGEIVLLMYDYPEYRYKGGRLCIHLPESREEGVWLEVIELDTEDREWWLSKRKKEKNLELLRSISNEDDKLTSLPPTMDTSHYEVFISYATGLLFSLYIKEKYGRVVFFPGLWDWFYDKDHMKALFYGLSYVRKFYFRGEYMNTVVEKWHSYSDPKRPLSDIKKRCITNLSFDRPYVQLADIDTRVVPFKHLPALITPDVAQALFS